MWFLLISSWYFLTWPLILFWKSCPTIINWFASWSFDRSSILFNLFSRSVTAWPIQIGHQWVSTRNIHVTTSLEDTHQLSGKLGSRDQWLPKRWMKIGGTWVMWCCPCHGQGHLSQRVADVFRWKYHGIDGVDGVDVYVWRFEDVGWCFASDMVLWHPEKNTTTIS